MRQYNILFVDDCNSTRELISNYLSQKGYNIIGAPSGKNAIEIYKTVKPDIILLDIVLPDITGYDVAKIIRNLEETSNEASYAAPWTPIIFLTANSDQKGLQEAVISGGDDYLVKPIPLPSIKSKIEVFIRIIEAKTKYIEKYRELSNEKKQVEFREHLLNKIFDTSPFGIVCIDNKGRIMMANQSISDMFNLNVEQILSKPITKLVPDLCSHNKNNSFKKTTTGKTLKLSAVNYDNKEFPVYIRIDSFTGNDNLYFVISIEDISKTQELSLRLEQTSKLEAMGNLAAGIAHDFNNILATSVGYVDLALDDARATKNDKAERYLNAIAKSHDRAKKLIQQMLDFGRTHPNNFQLLEINSTIENIISMLQKMIHPNIGIKINLEIEPLYTIGTKDKLEQIIMNLVINAKDAVEKDGIITISLIKKLVTKNKICTSCNAVFNGDYALLSIKDNGNGIDDNVIHKIFDPFFTTKGPSKGSGMGLAVVHGIVHSFKGHILIETSPNNGTTIKIFLPIYDKETIDNVTEKMNDYSPMEQKPLTGNKETICLIDDESQILNYLSELLIKNNYNVISFNSPVDFINDFQAKSLKPDLIISDLSMPHLTGVEIAKKLRNFGFNKNIILFSGFNDDVGNDILNKYNICCFLHKPISNNEILQKINEYL